MTIPEPATEAPSKEELDLRIANLRSMMAEKGLDVYVAAHTDNVYYLTNFAYLPFERPFFLVVPATGIPVLVTDDGCVSLTQYADKLEDLILQS